MECDVDFFGGGRGSTTEGKRGKADDVYWSWVSTYLVFNLLDAGLYNLTKTITSSIAVYDTWGVGTEDMSVEEV